MKCELDERQINRIDTLLKELISTCCQPSRKDLANGFTDEIMAMLDGRMKQQEIKDGKINKIKCQYCEENKPLLEELVDLQISKSDAKLWLNCITVGGAFLSDHCEINYCPMCGKRL